MNNGYSDWGQLTPHAHSWLPDGVFFVDDEGKLKFHRLPPPTDQDVKTLLQRIEPKTLAACADYDEDMPDDEQLAVATSQYEASRPPLLTIPLTDNELTRPRCAFQNGFSLHADLAVHRDDRKKLERLLRYGLRPPFAQKRLCLLPDGRVRLKLRKPFYTGQTDITFQPTDFLRRLAASIPKPRQNMIRFHGIFAANAKHRKALRALVPTIADPHPEARDQLPAQHHAEQQPDNKSPTPAYRRRWAELLKRVYGHEVLVCPECQGHMKIIQFVDDPEVIEKICLHLGYPTSLPPVSPARAPPQTELDLEFADFDMNTDL